jgi:hypothetical protein
MCCGCGRECPTPREVLQVGAVDHQYSGLPVLLVVEGFEHETAFP